MKLLINIKSQDVRRAITITKFVCMAFEVEFSRDLNPTIRSSASSMISLLLLPELPMSKTQLSFAS